ncbi:hypothetical protein ZIOFF_048798 [Zingiber officinale]|uniref:Uncharacterized protein n=1 Tax=Zingiber officinale TaxID=94328 RepID=A0A8J5G8A1_ZINOF|nr:hypothetical protein ZIOFF_048798 [Zingiber officinale]
MMPMATVRASALLPSPLLPPLSRSRPSSLPPPFPSLFYRPFSPPSLLPARSRLSSAPPPSSFRRSSRFSRRPDRLLCRAAEYQFPDPIPEFALAETTRFRTHMLERLTKKKEYFGDSVGEVVDVCTENRVPANITNVAWMKPSKRSMQLIVGERPRSASGFDSPCALFAQGCLMPTTACRIDGS